MKSSLTDKQRAVLQECLDDERARRITYGPHRRNSLLVHGLEKRGLIERVCRYGAHQLRITDAGRKAVLNRGSSHVEGQAGNVHPASAPALDAGSTPAAPTSLATDLSRKDLIWRLRNAADDPMWAHHCEISKSTLLWAAELLERDARGLVNHGVFKGVDGLSRLAESQEFWDQQPYGTRLYFGDGGAEYLHRSVIRAAACALSEVERVKVRPMSDEEGDAVTAMYISGPYADGKYGICDLGSGLVLQLLDAEDFPAALREVPMPDHIGDANEMVS